MCAKRREILLSEENPDADGLTEKEFLAGYDASRYPHPSLTADISPDGKDHVWPLYDTENKWLLVFEEFDIHPERESDRKLVDWERTYFLTKYYC